MKTLFQLNSLQLVKTLTNRNSIKLKMKKKYLKMTAIMMTMLFLLSSCASIFSKSSYPIYISSAPGEANFVIKNIDGIEIYSGRTPKTLKLQASSGFFKKARYQVTFTKNGYYRKTVPIEFKIDGWYFGNILI